MFSTETYYCDENLPPAMFRLFETLSNLVEVRLSLGIENSISCLVRAYAKTHDVSVPHVKSLLLLYPSNLAIFLTDAFSDLTTLNIHLSSRTVGLQALASLVNLRALALERSSLQAWCLTDIIHLHHLVPRLQYLILEGELEETRVSVSLPGQHALTSYSFLSSMCLVPQLTINLVFRRVVR